MNLRVAAGKISILLAGLFALLVSTSPADATDYYVATNGSDVNPGTNLAAPFQTLQHTCATAVAGDICYLRAGTYHETLAPLNSGSGSVPIRFMAYSNEVVTLDGADAVTGWTYLLNGIYQAPAGWDLGPGGNQVFVDGVMAQEARYPNYGSGDLLHPAMVNVVVNSTNTALLTGAALDGKPDNYWAGAWFVGGVGYSWAWQSARVLSSTGATLIVDAATATPSWWFAGNGKGLLFGKLNLLDADNEWLLRTNLPGNILYLKIAGGADPSTHTVEMKRRDWCVDLKGRNNIIVQGLNLRAGAVRLQGNGHKLLNCRAQYLSHYLLISQGYLENGGTDQGGGVFINGTNNVVSGCTLFDTAGSGIYSQGGSNLITRNVIYNTDYSGAYACAIALHGNREIVTFNTAHSSGRDIVRPEGTGSDIRFNDLSNPGLLCKDLGVTYCWGVLARDAGGAGTRIAYNWVHDDSSTNDPLRMGVYLDNWCANYIVDHNVIWNCPTDAGIRINGPALDHLIYNNTLFDCDDVGSHPYDSWPNNNPSPAFWTNDVYQYSASNNLYLASAPETQLVNWTNWNFQLKPGAAAIDAGLVIPGFTEGYLGAAPDLGALESGRLPWTAGAGSVPRLAVSKTGDGTLTLAASPDAAYYQLYFATNLAPPAFWVPVTNSPSVSDNDWSVTLPLPKNQSCYYRLQYP